ncbi:hypothetical protein ACRE_006210 [Hapsidospora chrysogenum ATCC 11550]|uniref:Uncharacterized protein n=1 Tax=Hapsidospora chrysogenum (strain ATCC 11550 / CBS 779.69 / DSM 880 / IAM 14645 / JCM 23072 / IMI 49137) TaxID=857340 RepID=A0A086TGT2_HAPC1|nr:hypothetical protein ACRE_006210 [Hapsidospora chrysogenum ATCC 11550]
MLDSPKGCLNQVQDETGHLDWLGWLLVEIICQGRLLYGCESDITRGRKHRCRWFERLDSQSGNVNVNAVPVRGSRFAVGDSWIGCQPYSPPLQRKAMQTDGTADPHGGRGHIMAASINAQCPQRKEEEGSPVRAVVDEFKVAHQGPDGSPR